MKRKKSKKNNSELDTYPRVWGLTGGIASGKSLVAQIFKEFGVPVIDADQVSRSLMADPNGQALAQVVKKFGTSDRAKLRQIIFSDPAARKDLEKILHPLIQEESARLISDLGKTHPLIIYEGTLLIEAGRYKTLDGIIAVESPEELRLQRLTKRDLIEPELAATIIRTQNSDEFRRKYADYIVSNTGSVEELKRTVRDLINKLS